MESIQWSKWMSVGIDVLDEDHRILIAIVNKLADESVRSRPEAIGPILDELIDYTRQHFAREEAAMEAARYPAFAGHKVLHDRMTEQVDAYRHAFADDPESLSGEAVFEFCAGWLARHILREDTRFGDHAAALAAKAAD